MVYLLDEADDPPRVGFSVPRRVGNAVERNRIRRRLRALAGDEPVLPSGSYLLLVDPPAATWTYEELRTAMAHLSETVREASTR
jgi:ribonuclease P protein component